MKKTILIILLIPIIYLIGCSKSDNSSSNTTTPTIQYGTFKMKVNGQDWQSKTAFFKTLSSSSGNTIVGYSGFGANGKDELSFQLWNYLGKLGARAIDGFVVSYGDSSYMSLSANINISKYDSTTIEGTINDIIFMPSSILNNSTPKYTTPLTLTNISFSLTKQ